MEIRKNGDKNNTFVLVGGWKGSEVFLLTIKEAAAVAPLLVPSTVEVDVVVGVLAPSPNPTPPPSLLPWFR